jgi:hypothetical protein
MEKRFAIHCEVLRRPGDCTNGGVTGKHDDVVLIGPDGGPKGWDPAAARRPVLKLVVRNIGGREYMHAEPLVHPENMVGPMAGGNYIWACDAPFRRINAYPIPVHDRFETAAEYERNST